MAMTAWSAKVSSSLICAGVKGRTSVRRAFSTPMTSPSRSGTSKYVRASRLAESQPMENRSAREHRECGACHARASSETVAHQY